MKTSIVIALAVLGCLTVLFVLGSRSDPPVVVSVSDPSRGPSFEVQVVRPRMNRPLFGILGRELEAKLQGSAEGFDHTSRGAGIGGVGHDRLELGADGWDLSIEADGEGRIAPATRLVFPWGDQARLRCRPAEPAVGYLRTTPRPGSGELDGSFLVELTACENARTGKTVDWPPARPFGLPPAPLTVRGSFAGLPHGRR